MTQPLPASARRATVEVPKRMRTLPRDPRGYPIPFIVVRDKAGVPHFTINDNRRVADCLSQHRCAICGKRLDRDGVWFVGGSRCFLHEFGAFLDPPAHLECAEYALRICPFLAARRYGRRIDFGTLSPEQVPDDMVFHEAEYVAPSLPERFGLGRARRFSIRRSAPGMPAIFVVDDGDWLYVEFWRAGEPINAPETAEPEPIPADDRSASC